MVIEAVNTNHAGEWLCAAKLEGQKEELQDTIELIYISESVTGERKKDPR